MSQRKCANDEEREKMMISEPVRWRWSVDQNGVKLVSLLFSIKLYCIHQLVTSFRIEIKFGNETFLSFINFHLHHDFSSHDWQTTVNESSSLPWAKCLQQWCKWSNASKLVAL